jgi:hypothetical protein
MDDARAPWQRPPLALLAGVALAHAVLLGLRPPATAPSMRPVAPTVQVRVVDASTTATVAAVPAVADKPPQSPARAAHAAEPHPSPASATPPVPRSSVRGAARTPVAAPQRATAVAHRATPRQAPAPAHDSPTATALAARAAEPAPDHGMATATTDDAAPVPVRLAPSARLRYQVHGMARGQPFDTDAELVWQRDGDRYRAEWTVQLATPGPRTQRSEGAVTAAGLLPERYAEQARGERAAHFDAAGGRIRFSANTPDAVLNAGAQDRLSASLQLGGMMAAAPHRYPAGSTIVLPTAGVRDTEPWRWDVLPDETLQIDDQDVPCTKLVRQPRREYDSRVELWLARTHAYLPARLRTTLSNGDTVDQRLAALPAR